MLYGELIMTEKFNFDESIAHSVAHFDFVGLTH